MKKKLCTLLIFLTISSSALAGYWIRANDGYIPSRAWSVGRDIDGNRLYLCQANYKGSTNPGKLRKDFNGCHISYAGQEIIKPAYRVFVGNHRGFWRNDRDGNVPRRALRVGRDSNGAPLFLCRVRYQDSVQIGKVRPGIGGCNIAFGGKEIVKRHYAVFVQRHW